MSNQENVVVFPDAGSIEEAAALWVARMDTGPLSVSDRAAFTEWLKQTPLHREALERMAAVWSDCNILDDLNLVEPLGPEPPNLWARAPRGMWIGGAIAACVLVIGLVAFGGINGWFFRTQIATFATAVGQQRTIHLVDGSTIVLNTNSEIDVDLRRQTRSVRLVRGEANFEVAKDSRRPFFVYARDNLVRAVGTAFAVYLRENAVEVTVSEGVVELLAHPGKEGGAPGKTSLPAGGARSDLVPYAQENYAPLAALTVNETALFNKKVEHVEKLSKEALDQKLLWREGMIGFRGEPLSVVVDQVSRYTNVKIEIEDPTLKDTPIGGFFTVGDIDGLFEALNKVFHIEVRREGDFLVKLVRQS